MTTKRLLLSLCLLVATTTLSAQQDLLFTQQQFSRGNINPAGIGNTGDVDIFLLGRLQWIGVDNAPRTLLLNATNYFGRIQSAVGFTLSHDVLGVGHSTTEAKAEYAYQVDIRSRWVLSMGLSAGVFVGRYDPSVNKLADETERKELDLSEGKQTEVTPDFNLGFELNSMAWTFGVSCTHLQNKASTSYSSDRHFYGYVIRTFNLSERLDLMASLAYMNRNKTHLTDCGVLLFLDRFIWGGLSWRPDWVNGCNPSYLSAMAGFEWKAMRLGYLYEWGMGNRSTLPSNTHEILLSFKINKKQ